MTHSAFVAVTSNSFVPFVDDSNCSSPLGSSLAIADDVVVRSTSMSWVKVDFPLHYVAFVALMDGMMMHNPCSKFA